MHRDRLGRYPLGTGAAFWNALREEPDREHAVAWGNDGLFVCKRGEVPPGPGVCGYRGPRFPVTDDTSPSEIIAADMEGNHADGSINILDFSGSMTTVFPGSPPYLRCREVLSEEGVSPPRQVRRRVLLRDWGYVLAASWLALGILGSWLLARSPFHSGGAKNVSGARSGVSTGQAGCS